MRNANKTKKQLIEELGVLRLRMAELEKLDTKRKRAEERLRESERKFRRLFANMMDGFMLCKLITDEDGNPVDYIIEEMNAAAERILHWKRKDSIDKKAMEISNGEVPLIERYAKVAQDGKPQHLQRYEPKRGRWYDIISFCPERGDFATIFRDITEVKKRQEEVERHARQQVAINAVSTIANESLDLHRILNHCLDKVLELVRLDSGTLFLAGEEKNIFNLAVHRGISPNLAKEITTVKLDVTEERQRQQRLYLTNQLASVGEMASGIAHELNNPLTSIIGFSQLLMERDIPDDIQEDVRVIHSEAQRTAARYMPEASWVREPPLSWNYLSGLIER